MGMIGFLCLCLKTWIGILEDVVTVYSTSEETFPRYSLIIRRLLEILELRWRYTITKLAERYWFITWFGGCLVEWLAEWLGLPRVVRIHKLYLVSYNLALIKPWVWGLNVTFLARYIMAGGQSAASPSRLPTDSTIMELYSKGSDATWRNTVYCRHPQCSLSFTELSNLKKSNFSRKWEIRMNSMIFSLASLIHRRIWIRDFSNWLLIAVWTGAEQPFMHALRMRDRP